MPATPNSVRPRQQHRKGRKQHLRESDPRPKVHGQLCTSRGALARNWSGAFDNREANPFRKVYNAQVPATFARHGAQQVLGVFFGAFLTGMRPRPLQGSRDAMLFEMCWMPSDGNGLSGAQPASSRVRRHICAISRRT